MKKLFTLLTLLAFVVGGVKAEDTTLFSANATATSDQKFSTGTTEITSSQATITGGKMYAISGQSDEKVLIAKTGYFSMTNNNTYFKIELNTALAEGDIITAKYTGGDKNGSPKGIVVSATDTGGSIPESACTATSTSTTAMGSTLSYTVTAEDEYVGKTNLYVYRAAGATQYFDEVTITRTVVDTRTSVTLSFPNASYNINLGETFTAPALTVDPTAAAGEVAYTSSNTDVATVDATTGAIALVAAGTTTITAAISGSETYQDATASYTLNVVDPNAKSVTATWAFNTGAAGQTATFAYSNPETDEYFYANGTVTLGSNLSYNGTQDLKVSNTANGEKSTKIRIAADTQTDANIISFTIRPRKGVTFTPTAVSFRATRCGTDGGKMTMTWYDANSDAVALGTAAAAKEATSAGYTDPARDNNTTQNWTEYSYDLTAKGAKATTGECGIKILLYGTSNKNYALSNIIIEGEYSGTPEEETMYTVTTSVTPAGAGSISQSPAGESLAEGTTVTFTATANTGYAFLNKWTVDGTEVEGAPYSIASLAANTTVEAQFKQLFTINYDKSAEGLLVGTCGEVLKTEYAGADDKFTAPSCLYIAKDGYTFSHWTDAANNEYIPGTVYTLTDNITLTPNFVENTVSLAKTLSATTVTWNFRSSAVHFNSQGNTQYYVQQVTIDDTKLDVAMLCDQTSGKLNNVGRNDEWAQANGGTKLTIPAVSGMTIVATGYKQFSNTKIAGSTEYEATTQSPWKATYTYTGTDATIDIVIGSDISYLSSVAVTYPKTHTYVDVTSVGYRTFASGSALDFTGGVEGLTAYRATVSGDNVSFVEIDGAVPAGEGMLLKADEGRYYIPLATGTPDAIENAFVGVTTATEVEAGIFVLMNEDDVVGFYKTKNAFTVGANTAYLPATTTARNFIGLDNETTGISAALMNGERVNGEVYNLNGQRVAQPAKGLYIVNGKKVIINK